MVFTLIVSEHQVQDSHQNTDTHPLLQPWLYKFQWYGDFTECDPVVPVHAFDHNADNHFFRLSFCCPPKNLEPPSSFPYSSAFSNCDLPPSLPLPGSPSGQTPDCVHGKMCVIKIIDNLGDGIRNQFLPPRVQHFFDAPYFAVLLGLWHSVHQSIFSATLLSPHS